MGKTLGIGSFGKARAPPAPHVVRCVCLLSAALTTARPARLCALSSDDAQVKMAEHALTGHKVAIKILNRKKIKAMDMDEKGAAPARGTPASTLLSLHPCCCVSVAH